MKIRLYLQHPGDFDAGFYPWSNTITIEFEDDPGMDEDTTNEFIELIKESIKEFFDYPKIEHSIHD
jgi:hypothetical protein